MWDYFTELQYNMFIGHIGKLTFNWHKVLFYIKVYTVLHSFLIAGNLTGDDTAIYCSSFFNQVILVSFMMKALSLFAVDKIALFFV